MDDPLIKVLSKKKDCLEFTLTNLTPHNQNPPGIYNVFVEFGDGGYTSFITPEIKKPDGEEINFSYQYVRKGIHQGIHSLMKKGIYGSDGDPKVPINTIDIDDLAGSSTLLNPRENRLPFPKQNEVKLNYSHLPRSNEESVMILHFDQIIIDDPGSHFIFLFFNEKSKFQWSKNVTHGPRLHGGAKVLGEGKSIELSGLFSSNGIIDYFDDFIAFEIPDKKLKREEFGLGNIFVSLKGSDQLSSIPPENRRVRLTAVHCFGIANPVSINEDKPSVSWKETFGSQDLTVRAKLKSMKIDSLKIKSESVTNYND